MGGAAGACALGPTSGPSPGPGPGPGPGPAPATRGPPPSDPGFPGRPGSSRGVRPWPVLQVWARSCLLAGREPGVLQVRPPPPAGLAGLPRGRCSPAPPRPGRPDPLTWTGRRKRCVAAEMSLL